jgi:hypothetical protein
MPACCPPGLGCNAPTHDQPCALELCRRSAGDEPDAALAVARWTQWQQARKQARGKAEGRFRLRAYERAREAGLVALLMHRGTPGAPERPTRIGSRARGPRTTRASAIRPRR